MVLIGISRAIQALRGGLVCASLFVHKSKLGDMGSLFKNIIVFISGFVIALIIYNDPIKFNSRSNLSMDFDSSEIDSLRKSQRPLSNKIDVSSNSLFSNQNKSRINKLSNNKMYNGYSSRPSLNDVPNVDERYAEQVPTAPPTGRPEAKDDDEETEETAENDDSKTNDVKPSYSPEKIAKKEYDNSDSEKSLSSMMPIVGAVVNQANNLGSNTQSTTPTRGAGGTGGTVIRTPITDVTPSDVVPDDFTQEGLAIAKRLYSSASLSEAEYLEYLNLGLQSNNSSLSNLALNELVTLKTKNSFLLLAQYASSSDSNLQSYNQAIVTNYKSASDLRFLSQMIADDSSVDGQNLAVHSLDVIINGNGMNFENQQIRDTLIQNVYPSLNRLSNSHPSYELARGIATDINELFS